MLSAAEVTLQKSYARISEHVRDSYRGGVLVEDEEFRARLERKNGTALADARALLKKARKKYRKSWLRTNGISEEGIERAKEEILRTVTGVVRRLTEGKRTKSSKGKRRRSRTS